MPFTDAFFPLFQEKTNVYSIGLLFQAVLWNFFHAWEFLPRVCGSEVGFNHFWQNQKCPLSYPEMFVVAERLTVGTCFPAAAFCLSSWRNQRAAGWPTSARAACLFHEPPLPHEKAVPAGAPLPPLARAELHWGLSLWSCMQIPGGIKNLDLSYSASYLFLDVAKAWVFKSKALIQCYGFMYSLLFSFSPHSLALEMWFPSSSLA